MRGAVYSLLVRFSRRMRDVVDEDEDWDETLWGCDEMLWGCLPNMFEFKKRVSDLLRGYELLGLTGVAGGEEMVGELFFSKVK